MRKIANISKGEKYLYDENVKMQKQQYLLRQNWQSQKEKNTMWGECKNVKATIYAKYRK